MTEIELLAIIETLKEFKGMLWGQRIKIYTDHHNLVRDALGMTSDRVYRWRLILEEYGPEIVYIKGIHNTVADAISRLDFLPTAKPEPTDKQCWMTLAKCWCTVETDTNKSSSEQNMDINHVFANRSDEEEEVYPPTVSEIAEEQILDKALQKRKKTCKYEETLIDNTLVLCKNGKLVIPKTLQHNIVAWYHRYLQHPGHTRLEETLRSAMYWPGLRRDV